MTQEQRPKTQDRPDEENVREEAIVVARPEYEAIPSSGASQALVESRTEVYLIPAKPKPRGRAVQATVGFRATWP